MPEYKIPLPAGPNHAQIQIAIEAAIKQAGYQISLKGSITKYPGCVHWLVKNGKSVGTLKVTFWPKARRAWIDFEGGRGTDWIDDAVPLVLDGISWRLAGKEEPGAEEV